MSTVEARLCRVSEIVPENRTGVFHRQREGYAMSTRRRFSGDFKAKVASEALRGDKTIQEIATRHEVHPKQASAWKQRAVEEMKEVFSKGAERSCGELPRRAQPPADAVLTGLPPARALAFEGMKPEARCVDAAPD